ncbi:MAG: xanthine dehydrogenase family protein subunit M [Chloroflexi bacterium]|nr:xanthine dehydrogenase family protein subunit M [Chloroflexota bacterium]
MIKDFEYFAPRTVQAALKLAAKYGDKCKIIGGGQSLLILMRQGLVAPDYLVSIKGISSLNYVRDDDREGLRIGALTPHRVIEKSRLIQEKYPVLAEMETRLASVQTRNWGTIGGNLAHADPAGDPAPVLIALGASVKLESLNGERVLPLEDFYRDFFETALRPGELLTEIRVPPPPYRTGAVYTKFNVIESDMATVGVAASVTLGKKNSICQDIRIVLGAVAPVPVRAKKAEGLVRGKEITDDLLRKAGEIASTEADPISDIHASATYRRELVKVLVKRMGAQARERAAAA